VKSENESEKLKVNRRGSGERNESCHQECGAMTGQTNLQADIAPGRFFIFHSSFFPSL
jgi:hypothetical protein